MFHQHFSARRLRIDQGAERRMGKYFCPTCRNGDSPGLRHEINRNERLKIVVSSSTLHGVHRSMNYKGDEIHVDYCTIPGATIKSLMDAWWVDYHRYTQAMDILLVAGLNNICKGDSDNEVMRQIKNFANTVDHQSEIHHPTNLSTFCVASMIYPPKLTWFPKNGTIPRYMKINKLEMMLNLNSTIAEFNIHLQQKHRSIYRRNRAIGTDGIPTQPTFQDFGLELLWSMDRTDGTEKMERKHDWEKWRSTETRGEMLHLNDEQRIKMATAVISYFKKQWGSLNQI